MICENIVFNISSSFIVEWPKRSCHNDKKDRKVIKL